MLTTEMQYKIGMTIRRLQDKVAVPRPYPRTNGQEDAKDRLDEAIIALLKVRIELDDEF